MQSPCIKVCVMDDKNRYCRGCFRTLDEISWWGTMEEDEQAAVLAQLPSRREASEIAEVPAPPLP